ncbi:uncharacterized protein RSE6_11611 [Rhynchosporium secalis]|uniref:Uncharacterized protein n=1 Tax=Rhynchosporium secalis TaxID=38038 RepID=A0A1E1MNG5_RHYSE|nr:uncharacterized protein RSE6_11611 [Rhynchosporium secalis]
MPQTLLISTTLLELVVCNLLEDLTCYLLYTVPPPTQLEFTLLPSQYLENMQLTTLLVVLLAGAIEASKRCGAGQGVTGSCAYAFPGSSNKVNTCKFAAAHCPPGRVVENVKKIGLPDGLGCNDRKDCFTSVYLNYGWEEGTYVPSRDPSLYVYWYTTPNVINATFLHLQFVTGNTDFKYALMDARVLSLRSGSSRLSLPSIPSSTPSFRHSRAVRLAGMATAVILIKMRLLARKADSQMSFFNIEIQSSLSIFDDDADLIRANEEKQDDPKSISCLEGKDETSSSIKSR